MAGLQQHGGNSYDPLLRPLPDEFSVQACMA
jgi:hypothetical protein